MAWTSPRTWVVAEKITAAIMNTHVRDNLSYLKGLLDGTGGAVTVTVPSQLNFVNDANFNAQKASGINPSFLFDLTDALVYERSTNTLQVYIGNVIRLALDSAGKMTGSGFYDSGDVSVTNGTTQSFTHGLGAQPRFYSGQHNAGSGVARFPVAYVGAGGTTVAYVAVDSGVVQIINSSGGTRLIRACAML